MPDDRGHGPAVFLQAFPRRVEAAENDRPRKQPQECQQPEYKEHRAPTVRCRDQAAGERARRGSQGQRRADRRIRQPPASRRHMPRDHLGAAGECDALTESEQHAKTEDRHQPPDKTGQQRARRPQRNARTVDAIHGEAIAHPADQQLDRRIYPEERRNGNPEACRGEPELGLHQRRRDPDGAAVDVVEENRERDEQDQVEYWWRARCRRHTCGDRLGGERYHFTNSAAVRVVRSGRAWQGRGLSRPRRALES